MTKIASDVDFMALAQRVGNQIEPKSGELEVRWFRRDGVKFYSVACGFCGENRLRLWTGGFGLRCRNCNYFHSYESFAMAQEKAKKASRINDAKIEQIRQRPKRQGVTLVDVRRGTVTQYWTKAEADQALVHAGFTLTRKQASTSV